MANNSTGQLLSITCTAFKKSGKYYSEGKGVIPDKWFLADLNGTSRREWLAGFNGGCIPGLSGLGEYFHIFVTFNDADDLSPAYTVPFLIPAET